MSSPHRARPRLSAPERREIIELAATEVFAERGYAAASMAEIAARSGVSVPVLYDHFTSKRDLHGRLLERHFAELRALWTERLSAAESSTARVAEAVDAWYEYVESHTYAWRMLFADTTGEPEVQAMHRDVAERSRAALLPLLADQLAMRDGSDAETVEMVWEAVRGVLQGLARWWYEHQDVPRAKIVAVAMSSLWIGLERTLEARSGS